MTHGFTHQGNNFGINNAGSMTGNNYFGVPRGPAGSAWGAAGARPGPVFGIVTALPEEFTSVRLLLDGETRWPAERDTATYLTGTMPSAIPDQPHQVVITQLGETGNTAAANGCTNLIRSFGTVRCLLMVGIAAGIPNPGVPQAHVRLGDIVVASWGVVDYDHVEDTPAGPRSRQIHPRPSPALGHAVKLLASDERLGRRPWEAHIDGVTARMPDFARPPEHTDVLVSSVDGTVLPHPDPVLSGHRPGRPKVHYGRIASADRALRDPRVRDELLARHDVRAVEMEGTGVGRSTFANGLEWHVIRGISDYGDRRAVAAWRDCAALAAAGYARALLGACFSLPVPTGTSTG